RDFRCPTRTACLAAPETLLLHRLACGIDHTHCRLSGHCGDRVGRKVFTAREVKL
ncbi:hypothetical protein PROFUN_13246, partial [Planoprotostelium fungivorum]